MKQRARRHLLSKQRSEIPEEKAWQDILRLLEQDSPSGAENYIRRMESIRLPKGIYAKWIRDPGESILEVMQRTGSHVQTMPSKNAGLFSFITLLGRPDQNAAAKKLLQESDYLAAVSEDDLNALKSLADYQLRSELSNRHGEALNNTDDVAETDIPEDDQLDDIDLAQLESAVSVTTHNPPTRAVWSQSPTASLRKLSIINTAEGHKVVTAPIAVLPESAIALTARVEELTAEKPRQLGRADVEPLDHTQESIRDELVALMIDPRIKSIITPLATGKALVYLAHHMYFPAVREVLNALKDVKLQLSADMFNALLDAAAQNENVVAFHYIVNTMRSRAVSANAQTWIAFHTLMLKRFPADVDKVVARMQSKAVLVDPSAMKASLEQYSAV